MPKPPVAPKPLALNTALSRSVRNGSQLWLVSSCMVLLRCFLCHADARGQVEQPLRHAAQVFEYLLAVEDVGVFRVHVAQVDGVGGLGRGRKQASSTTVTRKFCEKASSTVARNTAGSRSSPRHDHAVATQKLEARIAAGVPKKPEGFCFSATRSRGAGGDLVHDGIAVHGFEPSTFGCLLIRGCSSSSMIRYPICRRGAGRWYRSPESPVRGRSRSGAG